MDEVNFLESDIRQIADLISDFSALFSGKRVLMTGGNGFLGRYFRGVFQYLNEHVLEKKCQLILLDNFMTSSQQVFLSNDSNIQCLSHNVVEPFDFDEKLDYVIHAAGIASPYYYRAHPLMTLEVATVGAKHMLELARKHNARYTFFSSSEIYGDPDPKHVPIQESYRGNVSVAGPRACYDESKRLGETLCYIYHHEFGVHTNMIRPFNIYGPGMQEKDYRVLPNFVSRALNSLPLKVYGSGNQTRTFCYIVDAINGFLRVIAKGVAGEPYNIGNENPELSVIELVDELSVAMKRKVSYDQIEYPDSYPADEPQRRCPDLRKANLQLNYLPGVSLQDGLSRYISWAKIHYNYGEKACQRETSDLV